MFFQKNVCVFLLKFSFMCLLEKVSLGQIFLVTWYLWTRYPWVSVDQISMGICGPDIYVYLFLPEGKAVAELLIAIPVFFFVLNHF